MLAEVDFLRKVFSLIKRIVQVGSKIQGEARENLIKDLQAVSSKVHDAYSTIIKRLAPIKKAYGNPSALVVELRNLESDKDTRDSFKPSKLCGEVDFLLDRLKNNLDPLKYSVDIRKIDDLKQELRDMGSLDNALYEAYDRTMRQVGASATKIETQSRDNPKGQQLTDDIDEAKRLIQEFEGQLSKAAKEMTDIKKAFDEKYPDAKFEITEKRLKKISEVCQSVHGKEFAEKCIKRIKENGYINAAQRYFGLHYCADLMLDSNDKFLEIMAEFGFNWFKKYQPFEEKTT